MNAGKAARKQVPIMEGVFTFPSSKPQLIGSKCKTCGTYFFPTTFRCHDPACQGEEVETVFLSRRGKLWSYTVEYYPLPPPYEMAGEFEPFGIGQVEFPEGVRVAGIIVECNPERDLRIDMEMELVLGRLYEDDEGNEVMGWKFRPAR